MSEELPASEVVSKQVEITSNEELTGPPPEDSTQEDKPPLTASADSEDKPPSTANADSEDKPPPTANADSEEKPPPPASAENGTEENKKSESDLKPSKSAAPAPAKPKYRYDWYQTASDVYVNVMIKKLSKDQVHIEFGDIMVSPLKVTYVIRWLNWVPFSLFAPIHVR